MPYAPDDTEDLYYLDRPAPDGCDSSSKNPADYEDVLELYGPSMTSCGYCGRDREVENRRTFDAKAPKLTANIYQQLLDRGWRRSGDYCYYPHNSVTCCPNYSVSCSATKFKPTRSQIRCIDRMHSFLISDSIKEKSSMRIAQNLDDKFRFEQQQQQLSSMNNNWKRDVKYIKENFDKLKQSKKAKDSRFVASCERKMRLYNISLEEAIQKIRDKSRYREHARPDLTLEDYLYPRKKILTTSFSDKLLKQPKHRLRIRLIQVDSEESEKIREKEHEVIVKYQTAIHKDGPEEWSMSRFKQFLIDSPIKREPIRDRNYRSADSGTTSSDLVAATAAAAADDDDDDDIRKSSLSVDIYSEQKDEFALVKPPELPTHFGTYHCLYFLDEELIAVGVLDILPKCLTTVYFFYDPKYSNLNLGIYSALVEIAMVREMHKNFRQSIQGDNDDDSNILKYYYMGFYVHQSKKMHYKTTFKPSYLLCPETRHYVAVEKCLALLRERKYARFDYDHEPESIDVFLDSLLFIPVSVPVLTNSTKLLEYFRWLKANTTHSDVELLVDRFLVKYAAAVGPNLQYRILVKLDCLHRALVDRYQHSRPAGSRTAQ